MEYICKERSSSFVLLGRLIIGGLEKAATWLREIEQIATVRLSEMPKAFPVAPETNEVGYEIRQLMFGRYRILFYFNGNEVLVLRIRGPFSGSDSSE